MRRADALAHMRMAGYHDDRARFTRLFIEHRISLEAADTEFRRGAAMKKNGVSCTCSTCNKPEKSKATT